MPIVAGGCDRSPGVAGGGLSWGPWVFHSSVGVVPVQVNAARMAVPGGGDRVCPAPGGVDAEPELSGAAGDAGGDVQDPVAEGGDLAAGEVGVVGEADEFGPGDQIDCGQHDFEPGGVGVGTRAGQVTQPGGFGFADAVLDPGVLTMP